MLRLLDILLEEYIPEEESETAKQAHAKGWVGGGWGTWKDKSGKVVAKTINGQLVPIDQVQPQDQDADIESFAQSIRDKYPVTSFEIKQSKIGDIVLSRVFIPKELHGQGIGTKIMDDLLQYADAHKKRITLTPAEKSVQHGTTSAARLQQFYKRFGFKPNKGRNKDFRVSDTMIRDPQ